MGDGFVGRAKKIAFESDLFVSRVRNDARWWGVFGRTIHRVKIVHPKGIQHTRILSVRQFLMVAAWAGESDNYG